MHVLDVSAGLQFVTTQYEERKSAVWISLSPLKLDVHHPDDEVIMYGDPNPARDINPRHRGCSLVTIATVKSADAS